MSSDDPALSFRRFVLALSSLALGAAVVYGLSYTLEVIDSLLYTMPPLAVAANVALIVLLVSVVALTLALVPAGLGGAVALLSPSVRVTVRRWLLMGAASLAFLAMTLTLIRLGVTWGQTMALLPAGAERWRYSLLLGVAIFGAAVGRNGLWSLSLYIVRQLTPMRWLVGALVPVAAVLSGVAGIHWGGYRTTVTASPVSNPMPTRPNILLVTFDALSNHDTGLGGYPLSTTPTLDALARHSTVFGRFYSSSTLTTPSVATILTGRRLPDHGVYTLSSQIPMRLRSSTLPSLLRADGYLTAASVSNVHAHPLHLGIGSAFDWLAPPPVRQAPLSSALLPLEGSALATMVATWKRTASKLTWMVRTARREESLFPPEMSFAQAETFLEQVPARQPFFLWVHVLAPHFPYRPRPPFLGRLLPSDDNVTGFEVDGRVMINNRYPPQAQPQIDRLRLRYDEWVTQCDEALKNFLDYLERKGLSGTTVLMVSADHGESFEGGYWRHGGANQYPAIINVPLLVHLPGQTEARRPAVVADQTSLLPTILELAGIAVPQWAEGPSLRPALEGHWTKGGIAYTHYLERVPLGGALRKGSAGVIEGHYQYVLDLDSGKGVLRDLDAKGAALFKSVAMSHPDEASRLRGLAEQHL